MVGSSYGPETACSFRRSSWACSYRGPEGMRKDIYVNVGQQKEQIAFSTAVQRFSPVLPHLVSLCIALFSGLWLFHSTVSSSLTSAILDFGLDPQRTQLVSALLLAASATLIGAVVGRRKLAVM